MRFGQLGVGLVFGVLALPGCGGTTRSGADASGAQAGSNGEPVTSGAGGNAGNSFGGTTGSGGAEPAIPTYMGVPIGDCRVPSAATRRPGCPATPPAASAACTPDGPKQCTYDLQVSEGRAMQLVYTCDANQQMWGAFYVPCGMVCSTLSGGVLELAADCEARQPVSCKSSDWTFAYETSQQWLDAAFERVISDCFGEARYDRQFQLELVNGCGTRVSSDVTFTAEAAACLKKELDNVRWDCGLQLSCTTFASYFL
jgi:hypothetical protein